jgi:ABC-type Zn uptake system ZnuABC Zn-binding protein ZnuA
MPILSGEAVVKFAFRLARLFLALAVLVGCAAPAGSTVRSSQGGPNVLAAETFLADIAQNVAGNRLYVDALIPIGVDPHSFEPTPADVRKVADSNVLIINGAGMELFMNQLLQNAGGQRTLIDASKGLTSRQPQPGEHPAGESDQAHQEGDPHFFMDPTKVITYVKNIRDGLTAADPAGKDAYAANADAYIGKLNELDAWTKQQVAQVPESRRLLVTNHESLGYFADRYGFNVVGAIIPSVSTEASPSAQELAYLADQIKATGAPAIFLETGSNPQLADQLAGETGIKVITGLLTHSISAPGGPATDYLSMMRYDVNTIVSALR